MMIADFLGDINNGDPTDILDFLDFPMESVEGDDDCLHEGNWDAKFQVLGPVPSESFLNSSLTATNLVDNTYNNNSSEQKLLPSGAEDASRESMHAQNNYSDGLEAHNFQVRSPVSVLESSSSCSVEKNLTSRSSFLVRGRARTKGARTKRSRCSTSNPWLTTMPSISSTLKIKRFEAASTSLLQADNFSKPNRCKPTGRAVKSKAKKKMMLLQISSSGEIVENSMRRTVMTKRCTHCEVTKTPQWREGPMGPKTLCNACGVRYRSGRLFPEYRPAASPTFIPTLHSNSHKRVIEMRKNAIQRVTVRDAETKMAMSPPDSLKKVIEPRKNAIQRAAISDAEPRIRTSPPQKAVEEADDRVKEPPKSPPPEFVPMCGYLYDCILGN
ncbi:hypothetical protein NMG60_11033181 [Bertholletia excelsa]